MLPIANRILIGILLLGHLALSPIAWANPKNFIFDLTGSIHGFGDVSGSLWILMELREKFPQDHFAAVVDQRGQEILKTMFPQMSMKELGEKYKINFVLPEEARKLEKAHYFFQLFYGGRHIHHLTDFIFTDEKTINFIADTMHGTTLDEIRMGTKKQEHIYFWPPGLGPKRSGIVIDQATRDFSSKSLGDRKKIAAASFDGTVRELLLGNKWPGTPLGFLYGAHNETMHDYLIGQTQSYLKSIENHYPQKPLILFSPNNKTDLEKALRGENKKVVDLAELQKLSTPPNGVTIVALGQLPAHQFTALMASADFPVLIEGNSSMSTAIALDIPFLLYRSHWNIPQVQSLVEADKNRAHCASYAQVYNFEKSVLPNFEPFLEKFCFHTEKDHNEFRPLIAQEAGIQTFASKLTEMIKLVENIHEIDKIRDEKTRSDQFVEAISKAQHTIHDEALAYSLAENAFQHFRITEDAYQRVKKKLSEDRSLEPLSTLRKRFVPNRPNQTTKIEALEGSTPWTPSPDTSSEVEVGEPFVVPPKDVLDLYQTMKDVDHILKTEKIEYWAESGTLLGALRHHGLIPWDDDLDIDILEKDEPKLLALKDQFATKGLDLQWEFFGWKLIKRDNPNVGIDFFIMREEGDKLTYRGDNPWGTREGQPQFQKKSETFPVVSHPFGEISISIPHSPKPFMDSLYGPDWYDVGYQTHLHRNVPGLKKVKKRLTQEDRVPAQPTGPLKDK